MLPCLSACDHEAPEVSQKSQVPELPSLSLTTPVRGVFLGVWGTDQSSGGVDTEMTERRVWFAGGDAGDTPTQSTSLIAVYEPHDLLDDHDGLSETGHDQLRLHYETPGGILWWVWGSGKRGEVWATGDQGTILRLNEERQAPEEDSELWVREEIEMPREASLVYDLDKLVIWGVWGRRDLERGLTLWAVGGSVRRGGPKGVLLRRDAQGVWRRVTHDIFPMENENDPLQGTNFYKIWGRGSDVWIVGEGGVTLTARIERDTAGPQLSDWRVASLSSEGPELLFTVAGSVTSNSVTSDSVTSSSSDQSDNSSSSSSELGDTTWVVGGYDRGKAWRWNAQNFELNREGWEPLDLPTRPALNGVYVGSELVVGVGQRGSVTAWDPHIDLTSTPSVAQEWVLGADQMTLHSIWPHPQGGYWIVGGDLTTLREGVILTPHQWDSTQPSLRRQTW